MPPTFQTPMPRRRSPVAVLVAACLVAACLVAALFVAPPLAAQDAEPPPEVPPEASSDAVVQPGNYVVRPGDSLEGIAQRYLGSAQRWQEIWQLNQERVDDPNLLRPGWELTILWRSLPEEASVLTAAWNQVENLRPPRRRWESAKVHDVLRLRDRLQTFRSSSAELLFPDRTLLRLSEETLLLLEPTTRLGTTVERDQVQLLEGQADLEGRDLESTELGIELVIGDATASPRVDDGGEVRARARRAGGDRAQLMVYAGSSVLEAGGAKIDVPRGMGSTAAPGEAPTPPERLLDAPVLEAPAADAALATPRPGFSWRQVEGARSYTLEVCRDAACSLLERRVLDLEETSWRPAEKLPKAELYWRVTAVSPSGLDGYPAESRALEVLSDEEDEAPPTVAFRITPPRLAPRWGLNRHWILGPGARLEAVAEDGGSGIARWIPLLDGEETSPGRWQGGPWPEGELLEASFIAEDRAGHERRLEPVPFVFDASPPALTWGLEGGGPLGELALTEPDFAALPRHAARRTLEVRDPHRWWFPWIEQRWTVDLDGRQVVLRPNKPVRIDIEGQELVLSPERGLWMLAEDAVCESVYRLDYDLDLGREGRWPRKRSVLVLRLEAWDWVENRSRAEVRFETVGRR